MPAVSTGLAYQKQTEVVAPDNDANGSRLGRIVRAARAVVWAAQHVEVDVDLGSAFELGQHDGPGQLGDGLARRLVGVEAGDLVDVAVAEQLD
jgi:hypothetical protein